MDETVKKGHTDVNYVAVAGGVNIDIGGIPHEALRMKDSNPGTVTTSLGGVGRNIAHNLSLLGIRTKLFTVLGTDLYAERIDRSCRELGIDLHVQHVTEYGTSTYLYIADADGEMVAAVSDMEICTKLTPEVFAGWMDLLNGAAAIVLDANLPEETLIFVAENATVPLFADPVSVAKAPRFLRILPCLHTLKPNRLEAELLSGVAITDKKSLQQAGAALIQKGVRNVFITCGEEGVYYTDGGTEAFLDATATEVASVTGAGDAFMAGLVYSFLHNLDLAQTARSAQAAATTALQSKETINERLAPGLLRRMSRST